MAGKADLGKRIIAGIIDAVVAAVIGLIPVVGWLIGAAYWVLRDGFDIEFMDRRSIGKKVMKLRPVRLDGAPLDLAGSVQRNWVFGLGLVGAFLMIIPVIGWIIGMLLMVAGAGLVIVELVLVVTDPEGRRLGDKTGNTKVVEES